MVYRILNITTRKVAVLLDGTMTPVFENAVQAYNYWKKYLNESAFYEIVKVN
jgi:hypothetical protein